MKILIVSDAWKPQTNGVVRTLETTIRILRERGAEVEVVGPALGSRWIFALPSYPEIQLELFPARRLVTHYDMFQPDVVHIATEGPLGWAMRSLCLKRGRPFTTSYHTAFPEYVASRMPKGFGWLAAHITYRVLRRFHAPSSAVMVATPTIERLLESKNFRRIKRWSRGVDTHLFTPAAANATLYDGLARPIWLYVGRVAVEKNLPAFLAAAVPGTKMVVGDGPDLAAFKQQYPNVRFVGLKTGSALAAYYASADIFVFPSRTDTFGLVLLEAAASGLRVVAYPVPGPIDIFSTDASKQFAVLHDDISLGLRRVLALPPNKEWPRRFAETYSWEACTDQFYALLQESTPQAVKRITRLRQYLSRWWQHRLAFKNK